MIGYDYSINQIVCLEFTLGSVYTLKVFAVNKREKNFVIND